MTTERVRTTISLSPEALEVFKRMADAGNMSVSRCMGDWLVDTSEAAEMLTVKMEEAKRAPMRVMREMRAMVAGMGLAVDEAEAEVRAHRARPRPPAAEARTDGAAHGAPARKPPSSNTGVLVPPVPSAPPSRNRAKVSKP